MAHHLVLGRLADYLTGDELDDTHDERIRQALAHRLLDELGYDRSEIRPRVELAVRDGRYQATCQLDFVVCLDDRPSMLVRYAPGALVARERATVAMARLGAPGGMPLAVITNGTDARVLDAATGKVIATGLAAIPSRRELGERTAAAAAVERPAARQQAEARIVLAFEALECECAGPGAALH